MSEPTHKSDTCPFPTEKAFVVQFRRTRGGEDRFEGRVEHVVSGRTGRFVSAAGLLRLLESILAESRNR